MPFLEPVTLVGELVTLVPLSAQHHDGLVAAVRDGQLWDLWYTQIPDPDQMATEITRRLELSAAQMWLPFTVVQTDTGRVIGMTNFLNVDTESKRVEIGATWYSRSVQRTGVNTECKLLLLGHAFERLDCIAVEFRTHWMNLQSRAAIASLGAKQDGILRSHKRISDGSIRDTVVFSIIRSEWPAVRAGLTHRMAKNQPS